MSLFRYVVRRVVLYVLIFFFVISITWLIPRLLGNPIAIIVARVGTEEVNADVSASYFLQAFGLNKPLYVQYALFLLGLFHGDLGVSVWLLNEPVSAIVYPALEADIILYFPALIVSWFIGNYLGALAANKGRLDKTLLPLSYIGTSIPYFILALLLQYVLAAKYRLFPIIINGNVFTRMLTNPTPGAILAFLHSWILPFLSLLIVSIGGWATGMRNLMMYELESNYSKFIETLGFSREKVSSYAFRYAMNPQISGLGIQVGTLVVGAAAVEAIFNYPGLGYFLFNAIINNDPFLLEGCVILLVLMVVAANFIVDILYAVLDPRIRLGVTG